MGHFDFDTLYLDRRFFNLFIGLLDPVSIPDMISLLVMGLKAQLFEGLLYQLHIHCCSVVNVALVCYSCTAASHGDASMSKSSLDLNEILGALHIAWTRHWC